LNETSVSRSLIAEQVKALLTAVEIGGVGRPEVVASGQSIAGPRRACTRNSPQGISPARSGLLQL